MMRRAEIPLYVIVSIVITIAGIMLFLLLFSGKSELGKNVYCGTVYKLRVSTWDRKPDPYCDRTESLARARIEDGLNNTIAQLVLDCWNRAAYGRQGYSSRCDELTIPEDYRIASPVTEEEITGIIMQRELCHIISNNADDSSGKSYSCGEEDNIGFLHNITSPGNVLIEFDPEQKKVIVS